MPIEDVIRLAAAPRPPVELIRYVAGTEDYDEFLRSGAEVFTMFDLAARQYGGKPIAEFQKVLDFGCGIGRVLQFVPNGPALFGCDISRPAIEYTKKSFPRAAIHCNALMPPLEYADGSFDLLYSYSVFSHLTLDVENTWLDELNRVGAKGCLYLVTVQGDWMIEATLGDERTKAEQLGFYFKFVHGRNRTEYDFPDYYESSYHTARHIRAHWSECFDVVAVVKGDDPSRYLWGNLRFEPNGNIPFFRPMGQDLAVMWKR